MNTDIPARFLHHVLLLLITIAFRIRNALDSLAAYSCISLNEAFVGLYFQTRVFGIYVGTYILVPCNHITSVVLLALICPLLILAQDTSSSGRTGKQQVNSSRSSSWQFA